MLNSSGYNGRTILVTLNRLKRQLTYRFRFLPLGGVHPLVVFETELVVVSSSGVSLEVISPAMERKRAPDWIGRPRILLIASAALVTSGLLSGLVAFFDCHTLFCKVIAKQFEPHRLFAATYGFISVIQIYLIDLACTFSAHVWQKLSEAPSWISLSKVHPEKALPLLFQGRLQ